MSHTLPYPEAHYNLFIQQGATFRQPMRFEDAAGVLIPLAGLSAVIDIKDPAGTVLFSLTTGNSRIVLANTDPNITLYISDEDTTLLTWRGGEQEFLLNYANGDVARLWIGDAIVLRAPPSRTV